MSNITENYRIINTPTLVSTIKEGHKSGERFCFILGSGASVTSGIPSGKDLESDWMRDMEKNPGFDVVCENAKNLKEAGKLKYDFKNEILEKWNNLKENEKLSSEYYFDIYTLRFYPQYRNGYYFFEDILSKAIPSLGYNALAQFLTSDTGSNFVITTNFDTLTEDSLFIFTDKKPLVINHEALAEFANNPNIKRPIVAKIHRGLFFDPLNTPKETKGLKGNWAAVLTSIFSIYTPIVIGYGGGDKSLMKLLKNKNVRMKNGIYWCYYEGGEFPDEKIQKLVKNKNGYFVKTAGFDAVMLAIGNEMFKDEIMPNYVKKYLDDRNTEIYNKYIDLIKQKDTINQTTGSGKELIEEIVKLDNLIKEAQNQKEENKKLTAWDYLLKGFSASEANETDKAIEYYSKAIELKQDFSEAFYNRGNTYSEMKQYDKALEDYSKAIELKQDFSEAFCNRGNTYSEMER
ncbi:MAG: tetratricopeptide repeat protein [Clostridia bacterium]|nr:tetratricopeptide repeat protein [Clostridia bacterium]